MDNTKVCSILGQIYTRMHDCSSIDDVQFNICNQGSLADVDRSILEHLVVDLFTEHCRLTSLIIDVSHLSAAIRDFGFVFDDDIKK